MKLENDKYVNASSVTEGQNAMFQCLDKAYLEKLAENGSIYKGTASYQPFAKGTDYSVDIEKGILTIFKEKLTVGDNSITIKVNGYQTVRLSVPYQKVLEEVKLSAPTEAVELGNPVTITCTATHTGNNCDFFASLTQVTLTGPGMENGKILMPGMSESVYEELGYTISGNTLTLGKELFKTAGEYSVTIKAGYGYDSQTVKFTIKAKEVVPPAGDVEAPSVEKGTYFKAQFMTPAYWQVSFKGISNDDLETYLKAVTSVTVNGDTYEKKSDSRENKYFKLAKNEGIGTGYIYLNLTADGFTADGNTTVVVTATGYEELSFTLDATGKVVTGGDSGTTDPVDPSEPDATAAPTVKGLKDVKDWGTQYYRVSFEGMDKNALKAYLTKIKLVTVGSTTYTQSSYSSTNAYKLFATNTTYDSYAYDCLDLTSNGFPTDAVTRVAIEAEGYATLTFDVKNGQLVTDNNAGGTETPDPGTGGDEDKKAAPTYTYKGKDGYYNANRIEFGVDAETQSWLGKIGATSVKVNDSNVELASSSYDSNFASKFYIRKNENPSYVYIGTALLTQSRNTIEITVDGYKTLTITVDKDGNEVK